MTKPITREEILDLVEEIRGLVAIAINASLREPYHAMSDLFQALDGLALNRLVERADAREDTDLADMLRQGLDLFDFLRACAHACDHFAWREQEDLVTIAGNAVLRWTVLLESME